MSTHNIVSIDERNGSKWSLREEQNIVKDGQLQSHHLIVCLNGHRHWRLWESGHTGKVSNEPNTPSQ